VWGYGRPRSATLRLLLQETEEARRFAAERGWDGGLPEAWAGEMPSSLGLLPALSALGPLIRSDAAVAGWGGRTLGSREDMLSDGRVDAESRRRGESALRTSPRLSRCETTERLAWRFWTLLVHGELLQTELRAQRAAARKLRERRALPSQPFPVILGLPVWDGPDDGSSSLSSGETSPLLPRTLFERINRAVTAASEQAARGHLAEGYTVLLDGLRDAEEGLAAGAEWAGELVRIYQLALDNYVWRYRVALN
jgi:hypothetical protein